MLKKKEKGSKKLVKITMNVLNIPSLQNKKDITSSGDAMLSAFKEDFKEERLKFKTVGQTSMDRSH